VPLRINVDETSVCLFQGGCKGTVMFRKRKDPPASEPLERASRAKRRACLTHVAFICDRPDIQPSMPQVLIGNEATFLVRDMAALQGLCPANVHLLRCKSAWNNKAQMMKIIAMLAVALRPHMPLLQPILMMDACRVHCPPEVLYRCLALQIWPVIVPARLTWLLQPLDTHAFQKYKAFLKKVCQAARVAAASRELSVADFVASMCSTIRHVLQGNVWASAFDADGFGCQQQQQQLSDYVQRQLQITEPLRLLPLCLPRSRSRCVSRRVRRCPALLCYDLYSHPRRQQHYLGHQLVCDCLWAGGFCQRVSGRLPLQRPRRQASRRARCQYRKLWQGESRGLERSTGLQLLWQRGGHCRGSRVSEC
jgi:hypothetical protein